MGHQRRADLATPSADQERPVRPQKIVAQEIHLPWTSLTPRLRLNGCWNDAIGLCSTLTADPFSFDPSKVGVVIDNSPVNSRRCNKQAIVNSLNALAARSWKDNLEVAVVAYSGHGSHQRDYNGDEVDGQDEGICPTDCMTRGLIIDDQLHTIFSKFNPKTRVYAIFDCCHSGTIVDLPYTFPCVDPIAAATAGYDNKTPHVTMISGCRDSQTSADAYNRATHKFGGALTMAILRTLQDAGDGAATLCHGTTACIDHLVVPSTSEQLNIVTNYELAEASVGDMRGLESVIFRLLLNHQNDITASLIDACARTPVEAHKPVARHKRLHQPEICQDVSC